MYARCTMVVAMAVRDALLVGGRQCVPPPSRCWRRSTCSKPARTATRSIACRASWSPAAARCWPIARRGAPARAIGTRSTSCCAARPTAERPGAQRQKISDVPGPKTKNPVALAQKLANPDDVTYNNAVAIADRDGTVHFLFCLEYCRCFYIRSDDDGADLVDAGRDHGHLRQVQEPTTTGRCWPPVRRTAFNCRTGGWSCRCGFRPGTGGHAHRPSVTQRDLQRRPRRSTWQRGEIAVPEHREWIFPNETVRGRAGRWPRDAQRAQRVRSATAGSWSTAPTARPAGRSRDSTRRWSSRSAWPASCGSAQAARARQEPHRVCQPAQSRAGRRQGEARRQAATARIFRSSSATTKGRPGRSTSRSSRATAPTATWPCCPTARSSASTSAAARATRDKKPTSYAGLTVARFNLEWLTGCDAPHSRSAAVLKLDARC